MIYKFRITSDEDPKFVRVIEIDSNQKFIDLHNAIIDSVKYDSSLISSFFLTDDRITKKVEITVIDLSVDDSKKIVMMDKAKINDYVSKQDQEFEYMFDFFSERYFDVKLIEMIKEGKAKKYPLCSLSQGAAPPQVVIEEDKVHFSKDEYEKHLEAQEIAGEDDEEDEPETKSKSDYDDDEDIRYKTGFADEDEDYGSSGFGGGRDDYDEYH